MRLTPEEIEQLADPSNCMLFGLLVPPKRMFSERHPVGAIDFRRGVVELNPNHPLAEGLAGHSFAKE